MQPEYRIEPFDARSVPRVDHLARLHSELLPESPVVGLGQAFMTRFYYKRLVADDLLFGAVAYIDARPAGFAVATPDSAGFMRTGLRHHLPFLAWLMARSVVLAPGLIPSLWRAAQLLRRGPAVRDAVPTGELLSFGVLPQYRELSFVQQTGLRISLDLFERVMKDMAMRNVHTVRARVAADNVATQLFYRGLGWPLVQSDQNSGTGQSVEFVGQI